MERPITVAASAWCFIISATLSILIIVSGVVFLLLLFPDWHHIRGGLGTSYLVLTAPLFIFVFAPLAILFQSIYILIGIGLLRRWRWARPTALILVPLTLLLLPLGIPIAPVVFVLLLQDSARLFFMRDVTGAG